MKKNIVVVLVLLLCIGSIVLGIMILRKEAKAPREGVLDRFARLLERKAAAAQLARGPSVGVVRVFGAITFRQPSGLFEIYPRGALRTVKQLERLRRDEDVKAIVVQINSPGGTIGAVQEICDQIRLARQEGKKVVASIADMAFSGGYYIATACDEIVANPGSLTGSIGVILVTANLKKLFDMLGIKFNVVKSGEHKDIGAYWRDMTPQERELLQRLIMDCYHQFLESVSEGRGIPMDKLLRLADGRIFSGQMALQSKLVDRLGTFQDAVSRAAELAGIKGKPRVVEPQVEPFERFFRLLDARLKPPSLREALLGQEDAPIQYRANIGPAQVDYFYPSPQTH